MKIKLITVILVICCIIKLLHKQKGINVEDWSDYQGIMTWEESNEKCEGLQMRPPTRKEIKAAYNANLTDSWKKDGLWYWTSEKFSKEYAYYFNVEDGNVSNIVNFYSIHLRCIR